MRKIFKVLDLFSGIGGFSIGLEHTGGFETVAFCEIEPFCQQVLKKHWPNVPIYGDVRELSAKRLYDDGIYPDVLTGGFPCQDISVAGRGAGLAGERSGLWSEYHRLIAEIRPKWAIIENVSALRYRGLDRVLGSLAEIGFDAEWHCIPASAVGAPHQRDRVWIMAYPECTRRDRLYERKQTRHMETDAFRRGDDGSGRTATEDYSGRIQEFGEESGTEDVADTKSLFRCDEFGDEPSRVLSEDGFRAIVNDERGNEPLASWWFTEPGVGRVADGVPARVDRLRCLGNAVVPQIPEIIGYAVMKASRE